MSAFNVYMCHSHRTYKHVSTFERACMCDERGEKEFWIYSPLLINHLSAAAKSECIFRLVLNPNANILPHTQSVIFVISETGGFYNGFSWQQGGHKTKSNKATSVQYALTSSNWIAPIVSNFCKYSLIHSSRGGWLSRKLFFSLSENLASSTGKYYRNSAFPTLCKNIQSVEIHIVWDAIGWRVLCSVKTCVPLMRRRTHVELQFGQPRFRKRRIYLTF